MADVFISFVHEEAEIARAVRDVIAQELHLEQSVFLSEDQTQVYAGDQWLLKIREALADAKVVVLLFSKRASLRPWVNFEAGAAWLSGKPIIPCCYGGMRKDRLPHPYSTIQALNLHSEVNYLLASIHHHLMLPGRPPRSGTLAELMRPPADTPFAKLARDLEPRNRLVRALSKHVDVEAQSFTKSRPQVPVNERTES